MEFQSKAHLLPLLLLSLNNKVCFVQVKPICDETYAIALCCQEIKVCCFTAAFNTSRDLSSPSRAHRARNKVWLASDNKDSTSSGEKTTTPARRLSGHELKTKQGNRQWVSKIARLSRHRFPSTPSTSAAPSSAHPLKRLSGRESKTRHGNRQWVSKHVRRTPQLTSNYTRGTGHRGFHKQKERGSLVSGNRRWNLFSSQLISLSGQKFVVDSGGCRMKRVSLSTTSSPLLHRPRIRSRGRSVSESRQASVKQYLARYIVVMC